MPSLQSIVSAWTKINHDHVEYIDNKNGSDPRPQAQAHGGAPPGPQGAPGPPGHPQQQQGGPLLESNNGGNAFVSGLIIDPRTTTYANTPQQSLPSSSSLSSYSFTKNGVVHSGGGTADTNSLTATPPLSSHAAAAAAASAAAAAAVHNLAPPSQRYPLYPSQQSSHHPSAGAPPYHDASLLAVHGSSMTAGRMHRPSRRSQHHNHGHGSSHLHSQLESYGNHHTTSSSDNYALPPPPPQAGADAILGRRKSNNPTLVDRTDLSSSSTKVSLGEPPTSLSYSSSSAKSAHLAKAKSPSTSLWHSTTRSISSNHSIQSSSTSGAASVTASLDKMNASRNADAALFEMNALRNGHNNGGVSSSHSNHSSSNSSSVSGSLDKMNALRNGHGGGLSGLSRPTGPPSTGATIAELNASAEDALQSMKNLSLTGSVGSGGLPHNTLQHQQNPHNLNPTAMPTRQRSTRRFSKQRLRKSHSRSDLAREMALDRDFPRKRGSTGSTDSSATAIVRNSIGELDVSSSSILSQQMSSQQNQSQHAQQSQLLPPQSQLLPPHQRPHRTPSFLSAPDTIEENSGGMMRSTSHSSADLDTFRQQQHPEGVGKSLNDPMFLSRQRPSSGLNDLLIRNGPPGDHWMQDWFPSQPLAMPSTINKRQSSSSSSGTAITGNRSLFKQGANDTIHEIAATFPEKQPFPTTATARNNNGAALHLPSKQPLGTNTGNCDRCAQMETTLLSLQADLEYIRTLELQREFECKECDNGSVHHSTRPERMDSSLAPINQNTTYHTMSSERSVSSAISIGSRGSRTSSRLHRGRSDTGNGSMGRLPRTTANRSLASRTSMYLRDASKRLSDLSTRHKRQVKQTTHERAYWQNDMHLKLEKFAMMCKNLNEEAAHRLNEVKETKALLDKMKCERNTLVSDVDTLKARVELYEDENVEQSRSREEWSEEKTRILDSIDQAVKDRDRTIDDLSNRLELAVETIENERKHQRMRRQIIFPSSRPSPSQSNLERRDSGKPGDSNNTSAPSSPHYRPNVSSELPKVDDLERIQKSKEVAQKAQMALQAAMVQSATREKEMQLRLDAMERELAEAKSMMADSSQGGVHVPLLEMEGGGMSIRPSSSTASLGSAGALLLHG